jgi:hypothetical protein
MTVRFSIAQLGDDLIGGGILPDGLWCAMNQDSPINT